MFNITLICVAEVAQILRMVGPRKHGDLWIDYTTSICHKMIIIKVGVLFLVSRLSPMVGLSHTQRMSSLSFFFFFGSCFSFDRKWCS